MFPESLAILFGLKPNRECNGAINPALAAIEYHKVILNITGQVFPHPRNHGFFVKIHVGHLDCGFGKQITGRFAVAVNSRH
jgi:hypothetical protein